MPTKLKYIEVIKHLSSEMFIPKLRISNLSFLSFYIQAN